MQECDAYAFGVMLYELYSSRPGWAGLSTGDIISAKLRGPASASLQLAAPAPPALQVTPPPSSPPPLPPRSICVWRLIVDHQLSFCHTVLSVEHSAVCFIALQISACCFACLSVYSFAQSLSVCPCPKVVCSSDKPGCFYVHHLLGMLQSCAVHDAIASHTLRASARSAGYVCAVIGQSDLEVHKPHQT